jgi:hypothetical protein
LNQFSHNKSIKKSTLLSKIDPSHALTPFTSNIYNNFSISIESRANLVFGHETVE